MLWNRKRSRNVVVDGGVWVYVEELGTGPRDLGQA